MSRTLSSPRHRPVLCRPRLEGLEERLVLSSQPGGSVVNVVTGLISGAVQSNQSVGGGLQVVATSPAAAETLSVSPSTVNVTFGGELDPFSVGTADIRIDRLNADLTWSPAFGQDNLPAEAIDVAGTGIDMTPGAPLAAGSYRIVIDSGSGLGGADGSTLSSPGVDHVVGTFVITSAGGSNGSGGSNSGSGGGGAVDAVGSSLVLADAVDLGTVGPKTLEVAGQLDLATSPSAVALYKITVPAGHFWRLLAEVDASRDGSTLSTALALFKPDGTLIKAATVGRADAVLDPYLFAGLAAGTYYVGVSGAGNVPGQPGGYDPVAGTTGAALAGLAGGRFTLKLAADTADTPTLLTKLSTSSVDPLDPSPSGLTLTFDGLVDASTLRGGPGHGVEVVGADGSVWPSKLVGVDERTGSYTFLFDQRIPAGDYAVRVAAGAGLTDLAGLTPKAAGQPAGVLGTFHVAARTSEPMSRDLGTLYDQTLATLGKVETLNPGESSTYRFVAPVEGYYQISTQSDGGTAVLQFIGNGTSISVEAPALGSALVYLKPGVYLMNIADKAATPLIMTWRMSRSASFDSLLDNGVGQGAAMNMRLVSAPAADAIGGGSAGFGPGVSSGAGSTGSAASGLASNTPTVATASPAAALAGTSLSTSAGSSSASVTYASPAGLSLSIAGSLVGRPSASDHVGAVGPTAGSGRVSLASGGDGLMDGINYESSSSGGGRAGRRGRPVRVSRTVVREAEGQVDGAIETADAAPEGATSDDLVVAAVDWLTRMSLTLKGLVRTGETGEGEPAELDADLVADARPRSLSMDESLREEGKVERAQFETPAGLVAVAVIGLRYHGPLRRWLERHATRNGRAGEVRRKSSIYRGMHGHARVTC